MAKREEYSFRPVEFEIILFLSLHEYLLILTSVIKIITIPFPGWPQTEIDIKINCRIQEVGKLILLV